MSTLLITIIPIIIISLFLNDVFAYQFYYYCYNITRNIEEHKHKYTKEKFGRDSAKEYIINKFPNQRDLIEATIDTAGTAVTWYGVGNTVEGGVKEYCKKSEYNKLK